MKAVFEYPAKIVDITEKNASFDACVVRIMYHGWNRKDMYFSKSVVERAIPSIYYCPIVTNYDINADEFGGHDIQIAKRDDGSIRLINLTDGIGVIPNDAEWYWETVTEDDGEEHEYLCVHAILWKRSAAYEKIKRDGFAAHSMEINIDAYHRTDDGVVVDDFTFEAFTVIGVEPCFESSGVFFSLDKDHLSEMLEDYKRAFSLVNSEVTPTPVDNTTITAKGGDTQLDINELLAEFSLTEADIDFEIGDMAEDEVRAKFAAIAEAKSQSDNEPESGEPDGSEPEGGEPEGGENFSLTATEIEAQIFNALCGVQMLDPYWHEMTERYWYHDRDDEAHEIYAYDRQNRYVVGIPYSMSGDKIILDFEAAKHKKIQYVDFMDGAEEQVYLLFDAAQKNVETHVDALNQKIAELEQFKASTEAERAEAEAQAVFAMFQDLAGNEAFEAIIADHSGMDRSAIEKECYAIRGMSVTPAKFSVNNDKPNRVAVSKDKSEDDNEPYNGLFKKYL